MSLETLDPNHELFVNLRDKTPVWWQNLLKDPQIYVDVRKDNSLNIYFRGASLMDLSYAGKYIGKINYKYVPIQSKKNKQLELLIEPNSIGIDARDLEILTDLRNFDRTTIQTIKERIKCYYPKSGEKALQARLVTRDSCIIDSEFAYEHSQVKPLRIDLVRLDPVGPKIVFFELKQVGDVRLDVRNLKLSEEHVTSQLERYCEFIRDYKEDIGKYYAVLFQIKKELGLIRNKVLLGLPPTDHFDVLEKPILLVGGCSRKWIKEKSHMIKLNKLVEKCAAGCYYFGNAPKELNLIPDSKQKRFRSRFE